MSVSQDSTEDSTPSPATTRRRSTRSRARRDLLHDSAEAENKNKNEDTDATRDTPSHDLPEWRAVHPQAVLDHHFLRNRRERWYRVSIAFFTLCLKVRNCEVCERTKITRTPCRRRTGNQEPRAEKFGDLLTADHKVPSEDCESRNNHQCAVVVQDLATMVAIISVQNQTFSGNRKELTKVSRADRQAESHLY